LGDRLITGLGGGIDGSLERLNRALGERLRAQLGKKAAQPEEDLDHYVHNLPEVIPVSVSQVFTGICGGPLREGRVMLTRRGYLRSSTGQQRDRDHHDRRYKRRADVNGGVIV
jgi:hypothetical protein